MSKFKLFEKKKSPPPRIGVPGIGNVSAPLFFSITEWGEDVDHPKGCPTEHKWQNHEHDDLEEAALPGKQVLQLALQARGL